VGFAPANGSWVFGSADSPSEKGNLGGAEGTNAIKTGVIFSVKMGQSTSPEERRKGELCTE